MNFLKKSHLQSRIILNEIKMLRRKKIMTTNDEFF